MSLENEPSSEPAIAPTRPQRGRKSSFAIPLIGTTRRLDLYRTSPDSGELRIRRAPTEIKELKKTEIKELKKAI